MEAPDRPAQTRLQLPFPVHIRLARADDLPKLEWLGQYLHFRTVYRQTFRDQLAGRRFMLVADGNGFPIAQVFAHVQEGATGGILRWGEKRKRAYFYSFRVMEMFRGLGVGTLLLSAAEKLAQERGCAVAGIAAARSNPRARQLYERLGYRVVSEDDGRWSYTDHRGRTCTVHEPCWVLEKFITIH